MVRKVAGNYFLFSDEKEGSWKKPIFLNEIGFLIYEELSTGSTQELIAKKISNAYDIDYETALSDVSDYQKQLFEYVK